MLPCVRCSFRSMNDDMSDGSFTRLTSRQYTISSVVLLDLPVCSLRVGERPCARMAKHAPILCSSVDVCICFFRVLTEATAGRSLLGALFQWVGLTRASDPPVSLRSLAFIFLFCDMTPLWNS